ncbi:MAG: hypothetical protein KIT44_13555 [Opitutaceae bacterium]|nr:hypothetical protein [Opitutaceae bacterium]
MVEAAYPPILPNRKSTDQTDATRQIDLHYAQLGIIARWDWERYTRLALFLNLTVYELASYILMPHSAVRRGQRDNRFPGPACLLLTLLEARATEAYGGDVIKNPMPKITKP